MSAVDLGSKTLMRMQPTPPHHAISLLDGETGEPVSEVGNGALRLRRMEAVRMEATSTKEASYAASTGEPRPGMAAATDAR